MGPKANPSPDTPALAVAPAVTRARARALAVAVGRYLAIILACFATEHEESKQTAQRQAEKKKTMRADLSAAYKRASAKWRSSKLCVIEAERRGSAPSVLEGSSSRLSGVAMEAAAAAGVGLTPRLMRRKSSSLSGRSGSASSLSEASATLKEESTGKKRRKSTERQAPPPPRPRPPPKPEPEETMSEDQAALALQNSWRRHEARILTTSMRDYRKSMMRRNSRAASYKDPLNLEVSVPVLPPPTPTPPTHTSKGTHARMHSCCMHPCCMHLNACLHACLCVRARRATPRASGLHRASPRGRPWRGGGRAGKPSCPRRSACRCR